MKNSEIVLCCVLMLVLGVLIGRQTAAEVTLLTKEVHHIRLVQPINLRGEWRNDEEGHIVDDFSVGSLTEAIDCGN